MYATGCRPVATQERRLGLLAMSDAIGNPRQRREHRLWNPDCAAKASPRYPVLSRRRSRLRPPPIERLAIRRSLTSNLLPMLSGETIRDLGRVLRWRASETGGRPRDVLRPEVLTLVSADRRRALIDAYAEGLRLRYDAVYPAIHRVGDKLAAELEARIRLGSPIPMARVRLPWKRPKHTSAPNKKSWRACEGS